MEPTTTDDEPTTIETDDDQVVTTPADPTRKGARGTEVVILGSVWLFADYMPAPDPVWDRLYDDNVLKGFYNPDDVNSAAIRLLYENYELDPSDLAILIHLADRDDLVRAVEIALVGPTRDHRTYSEWIEMVLLANRIDRASVPPEKLTYLLDYLESAGLAMKKQEFISSQQALQRRAELGIG